LIRFINVFFYVNSMRKEIPALSVVFIVFGMLMSFPMMLADDDNPQQGSGNNSYIISAANNNSGNGGDDSGENVCCKVYGLGSRMKQVNIRYGWAEENEGVTPQGFVGGGREIVDDEYCETETQFQAKILTQEQIQNITRTKNKIRTYYANQSDCPNNCTCTGSTIKCEIEGGRIMNITAGKSGNLIVQVKKVNMSTNVTLYKSEKGEVYGVFRNNETRIINLLPDQVQEKIRNKTKAKLENQTIELDEDGIYQIQGKKKARLFFLFSVRERVRMQIDCETGELVKARNPWWGFLANDVEEE